MSITISSFLIGLSASSFRSRCMGFVTVAPLTFPHLTARAARTPGSIPPTVSNFKKPLSSAPVIISPTSSIWASTITFLSGLFSPFLKAVRLPSASVFNSASSPISFIKNSRRADSPPETASIRQSFSKSSFIPFITPERHIRTTGAPCFQCRRGQQPPAACAYF